MHLTANQNLPSKELEVNDVTATRLPCQRSPKSESVENIIWRIYRRIMSTLRVVVSVCMCVLELAVFLCM